jgi:hypothetical protein
LVQFWIRFWGILTSIDSLLRGLGDRARVVGVCWLCSDASCGTSDVKVAAIIHGFLERVVFPAEDVVAVSG